MQNTVIYLSLDLTKFPLLSKFLNTYSQLWVLFSSMEKSRVLLLILSFPDHVASGNTFIYSEHEFSYPLNGYNIPVLSFLSFWVTGRKEAWFVPSEVLIPHYTPYG